MNDKRQDNQDLFFNYVINEEQRKQILLSLTPMDFSRFGVMIIRDLNMSCYMYLGKTLTYYVDLDLERKRYLYILSLISLNQDLLS